MWEQEKQAGIDSTKEIWDSEEEKEKNQKCQWWKDEIKTGVERKQFMEGSVGSKPKDCEREMYETL